LFFTSVGMPTRMPPIVKKLRAMRKDGEYTAV
jgi:hypothetical protein